MLLLRRGQDILSREERTPWLWYWGDAFPRKSTMARMFREKSHLGWSVSVGSQRRRGANSVFMAHVHARTRTRTRAHKRTHTPTHTQPPGFCTGGTPSHGRLQWPSCSEEKPFGGGQLVWKSHAPTHAHAHTNTHTHTRAPTPTTIAHHPPQPPNSTTH